MGTKSLSAQLANVSTTTLIEHHVAVLAELRARGLLRSGGSLGPDFAERLVCEAYGGTLAKSKNQRGWEVLLPDGKTRLQVKSRTFHDERLDGRKIVLKNRDFDRCVIVLFDINFAVAEAVEFPVSGIGKSPDEERDRYVLTLPRSLADLSVRDVEDVAPRLREAMATL